MLPVNPSNILENDLVTGLKELESMWMNLLFI